MTIYKHYQTMAFKLDWGLLGGTKLYGFRLGESFISRLKDEFGEQGIPTSSIQMALSAKFPNILSFNRITEKIWFYCIQPIDILELKDVFADWLATELEEETETNTTESEKNDMYSDVINLLNDALFEEIELKDDMDEEIFKCIPDYMAQLLHCKTFTIGEEKVKFHRIIGDSPAELISWPPLGEKKKYSFLLTIKVHSVPQRRDKIVHIRLGIRRYANYDGKLSRTTLFGKKTEKCTVLFTQNTGEDYIFCEGQLVKSKDNMDPIPNWKDRPKALFERLHFKTFPDPEDACVLNALDPSRGDWITAVVYFNQVGWDKMPATGTAAVERNNFLQKFSELVQNAGFVLESPLKRIEVVDFPKQNLDNSQKSGELPF